MAFLSSQKEGGMRHISEARLPQLLLKRKLRSLVFFASTLLLIISGFFVSMSATHAASSYCQVTYSITSQWPGGFGANITIQNTSSSAWTSWSLTFTFPASGQSVTQGWNGTFSQSNQDVTVINASYNGSVAVNGTAIPGFNGAWTASNPIPTAFNVNGNVCNSPSMTPTPGTTPTSTPGMTPTPTSTPPVFTPVVTPTPLTL